MSISKKLKIENQFWETKSLSELSQPEWESLCDGCAKCCTLKLEDEDDGVIYDTNVVCQYLDSDNCLCQCYNSRSQKVPTCVSLTPENIDEVYFMPPSCSYRLLIEDKPLPSWHHLISKDKQTIHEMGRSVRGQVISEKDADDDLFHHLTEPMEG